MACGSSLGTVYLAELSSNLGTADKNDKQLLTHVSIKSVEGFIVVWSIMFWNLILQILERENKRERILEARMREMRLRMRQDRDGGQMAQDNDPTANDKDLAEATADYMQTVNELQTQQKQNEQA